MKNFILFLFAVLTLASCQKTEVEDLQPKDNVIRVEITEQSAFDVTKHILFMVESDTINNSQRFTDSATWDWSVNPEIKKQYVTILCSADKPFNCTYKVFVNDKLLVTSESICEQFEGGFTNLKIIIQ